jgi:hypothetical protein
VPAGGVPLPAGGVAGDVDADFRHKLGFHQRDDQLFLAAPPGGTATPLMQRLDRPDEGRSGVQRLLDGGVAWNDGVDADHLQHT